MFLFSVGFRYMVRGFSHDPFWSSHKRDDYVDNNYGIIIRIQTSPTPLLQCPQSSAEKIFPSEDLHFLQIPTLNPMLCICTHSSSHRWGFTIFLSYYSQFFSGWRHISLKFCLMDRRNSPHAVFCQTPPSEKQCAKPSLENMKLTHTWYLSFLLHWQNFWRIKLTPENTNFSRQICKKRHFFA